MIVGSPQYLKAMTEIEKLIKQDRFEGEFHKAYVNLIYTSNHFRDLNNEVFKSYKIQPQHYNLLRILKGKYPDPVTPGQIKEVMLDKGNDITRLIYKLEKLGWVVRSSCPGNKRNINITITRAGIKTLETITKNLEIINRQHKYLTEDEYKLLSNLLDRMRG